MNGIQRTSHQRWPDPTQFNDNFAWLRLIRVGTILVDAVNCDLLLADWFMVPDQMPAARVLRLLVLLPRVVATLFFLQRMGAAARERVALVLGLIVVGHFLLSAGWRRVLAGRPGHGGAGHEGVRATTG
jgi:hypothetical protein